MNRVLVDYNAAREYIPDGAVLAFRSCWWYTKPISWFCHSEYVHTALAAWWGRRLMLLETTASGGRAQYLSNIVRRYPASFDVYTLDNRIAFQATEAVERMKELTGLPYGWVNLLRTAGHHFFLWRAFVSPQKDDEVTYPPFCSQSVSIAYRAGGVDLCPSHVDAITEPVDIVNSVWLKYRGTPVACNSCQACPRRDPAKTFRLKIEARSRQWPRVERTFLEQNPKCIVCGRTAVTAHHVVPVHIDPSLELEPTNLVPVCEPASGHHLWLGHLGDWSSWNPLVQRDARWAWVAVNKPNTAVETKRYMLERFYGQIQLRPYSTEQAADFVARFAV